MRLAYAAYRSRAPVPPRDRSAGGRSCRRRACHQRQLRFLSGWRRHRRWRTCHSDTRRPCAAAPGIKALWNQGIRRGLAPTDKTQCFGASSSLTSISPVSAFLRTSCTRCRWPTLSQPLGVSLPSINLAAWYHFSPVSHETL